MGIISSSTIGDSKFILILAGSIKSSTILSVKVFAIVNGRGSNNFINIEKSSCDLSNDILTPVILTPLPKFKVKSLKTSVVANSFSNIL